ncbi:FAD dependent oxidoreductase [Xylariaceae sp. FL1272]|nr:FAD dependent oxidoreductase [Xylariaceae sp. FL1272]
MPPLNKQAQILIVGGGTWGLSTAYTLACDGYTSVAVLELGATIPSPLSAGNDVNKIIRAEYTDPFYADLALEAIHEWKSNPVFKPHYFETGYLLGNTGKAPEETKLTVIRQRESIQTKSAWAGKITPISTRDDIRHVVPAFDGPMEGWLGYFNTFAGYAHAANAMMSTYEACIAKGVTFYKGEAATDLVYDGDRCVGVQTASGKRFPAEFVVLTMGASIGRMLPKLGKQIVAKAWSVAHIQLTPVEAEKLKGIPVTFARDLGFFFEPEPGTGLLKICSSGAGICNFETPTNSMPPANNDFILSEDEDKMRQLLRDTLPALADRPLIRRHICWVADTADTHFVIDTMPGKRGLFVATGDSGHGFKMMPVVGRWIQNLIETGHQNEPNWRWKANTDATGWVDWRHGELIDLNKSRAQL